MAGNDTRLLFIADTTVSPIVNLLNSEGNRPFQCSVAPYDQVSQCLFDIANGLWKDQPEVLIVWTLPQKIIASFNAVLNYDSVNIAQIMYEVDAFAQRIALAAEQAQTVLVTSWTLPPYYRGVQSLSMRHNTGAANILMQMNLRLAEKLDQVQNAIVLDTNYWYVSLQGITYNPELYALGKIFYSRDFFAKAAKEIAAILQAAKGNTKKLIICDLDNTLWGGIIGDDGPENIKLGGIDPVGESFVDFQKALKALKNRGIILAVCSKNDESIAINMIESHPEMVLRKMDFAAYRINWHDKAQNIFEIVKELNIGLPSVVFFDDNPTERDRIRRALPDVFVPDLPDEVVEYPMFLHSLDCFETVTISEEDKFKTELYIQEQARTSLLQKVESVTEWLKSLNVLLQVNRLNKTDLPRAAQLLNKTNQFNMATRRITENELWSWSVEEGSCVYTFRVIDKFGNLGLTGLISMVLQTDGTAEIVDFIMSCRIMGKMIEKAMLAVVVDILVKSGISVVHAKYQRTAKNNPFWEFIRNQYVSGTDDLIDIRLAKIPSHIQITYEGDASLWSF